MVKRCEHHTHSQCPMACALDIIGDHWTLLIIRALMFAHCHEYKDMLAMPEGISSNILSDRLKRLEEYEIIASAPHPESKRRKLYYLTEGGKQLYFVLLEIVRWGDNNLGEMVHIPPEKRPFLDNPPEWGAKIVFKDLKEWEQANLPKKKAG